LDCDYSRDEFENFKSNICNAPNVKCKYCCEEGGCASWEKCHGGLFIFLIAITLLIMIIIITLCCLYRNRKKLKRSARRELLGDNAKVFEKTQFDPNLETITE